MRKHRLGARAARGQALLLAVIVMMVLALLAAAMVAVVSAGLEESGRDEHKVRARLLAEAGLSYADEMLTTSPLGADWRPELPVHLDPRDTTNFDQAIYDLTWDSYELLRGWDPQHVVRQYASTEAPAYFMKYRFAMDPEAPSTATESPQDDPSQDFVDPTNPVVPIENAEETGPHDH
ncbi:MAG: hypothetical protein HUU35_13975, partial [Armatimonadetes bacterium]|nr:hypothetical protein [Armatimonadota bacterium]